MKRKQPKVRNAAARALFDNTLPFQHRAERLKTRYVRQPKHKGRDYD